MNEFPPHMVLYIGFIIISQAWKKTQTKQEYKWHKKYCSHETTGFYRQCYYTENRPVEAETEGTEIVKM